MNVSEIIAGIVDREGGYVNDPDDPGGPTKYGVTLATARQYRLDKDGDGRVTANDVRALTQKDAANIYRHGYYTRPKIFMLPKALQASVFDMQVNAGNRAVKILQEVLAEFGEPVEVDGAIGPQTADAAKRVYAQAGSYLVDAYGIARRNFYFRLADRRAASRKYARTRAGGKGGWIRRAEEFISPKYHMTDEEFRQRVAKWG
ncbi:MAG: peptidoglycan-binding protein [Rhodobacterales bacterium]|nr:MAG: peptidoglycan-binding protein [Rhodobacterales bacterium]